MFLNVLAAYHNMKFNNFSVLPFLCLNIEAEIGKYTRMWFMFKSFFFIFRLSVKAKYQLTVVI